MITRAFEPKVLTRQNINITMMELLFPPPESDYFKNNEIRVNKDRFKSLIKGREKK